MAVFTELSEHDAAQVAEAHGLGKVVEQISVAAGSVNSNYFLRCRREGDERWFFVRLYEEQQADGVAYEWALLDHLSGHVPLAERVLGPAPGELRVRGRPVAVFERAPGDMICQRGVSAAHMQQLGEALARAHMAGQRFGWRRASRFDGAALETRWRELPEEGELAFVRARVRPILDLEDDASLPRGPIHGDLFRDNVLWKPEAVEISALLDWESAADGILVRDLAVVILSWCFGDAIDLTLAGALLRSYDALRPLEASEWAALHVQLRRAVARFLVTRVLDYELRRAHLEATGGVCKDFRRMVARIDAIDAIDPVSLREAFTSKE